MHFVDSENEEFRRQVQPSLCTCITRMMSGEESLICFLIDLCIFGFDGGAMMNPKKGVAKLSEEEEDYSLLMIKFKTSILF